MPIRVLSVFLLLAGVVGAQELTGENFETWRDTILPKPGELKWQAVRWRASFWDGVVEAQKKEMPILLWAMNGHPLACT